MLKKVRKWEVILSDFTSIWQIIMLFILWSVKDVTPGMFFAEKAKIQTIPTKYRYNMSIYLIYVLDNLLHTLLNTFQFCATVYLLHIGRLLRHHVFYYKFLEHLCGVYWFFMHNILICQLYSWPIFCIVYLNSQ